MTKRRILLLIGVIALVFLLTSLIVGLWFTWEGMERERSYGIAGEARDSLEIGMSRSETREYMTNAWRHYECNYSVDFAEDVYLFGSRNIDLAAIVILRFEKQDDDQVLFQIAGFGNYMLHLYDDCIITDKE